jgi:hypothetical protein
MPLKPVNPLEKKALREKLLSHFKHTMKAGKKQGKPRLCKSPFTETKCRLFSGTSDS